MKKVTEITAPFADHIITVETPDNPRALSAKKLKAEVEKINPSVEAAESIRSAVRKTMEQAQEEDVIVIFGSLSFGRELQCPDTKKKGNIKNPEHDSYTGIMTGIFDFI